MFIGRYYHKLEAKNRLSVPVKFRETLQGQSVLTKGLDGCLALYSEEAWKVVTSGLEKLIQTKHTTREYIRYLTNDAQEADIDSQGRILIADELKQAAALQKDVVIVGSYDHIEIWDQSCYHTYIEQTEKNIEDHVEHLEEPAPKS